MIPLGERLGKVVLWRSKEGGEPPPRSEGGQGLTDEWRLAPLLGQDGLIHHSRAIHRSLRKRGVLPPRPVMPPPPRGQGVARKKGFCAHSKDSASCGDITSDRGRLRKGTASCGGPRALSPAAPVRLRQNSPGLSRIGLVAVERLLGRDASHHRCGVRQLWPRGRFHRAPRGPDPRVPA